MSEHITFQAEHPQVSVIPNSLENGDGIIALRHNDGSQFLTPAEAIALGYALFSIGLTLKGK